MLSFIMHGLYTQRFTVQRHLWQLPIKALEFLANFGGYICSIPSEFVLFLCLNYPCICVRLFSLICD